MWQKWVIVRAHCALVSVSQFSRREREEGKEDAREGTGGSGGREREALTLRERGAGSEEPKP